MTKKWLIVPSDGTTWELVLPDIRLHEVEGEGSGSDIGP